MKQAPEAGGCVTGDRGNMGDMADREHRGDRGHRWHRGKRGHRADWVNSFKTLYQGNSPGTCPSLTQHFVLHS